MDKKIFKIVLVNIYGKCDKVRCIAREVLQTKTEVYYEVSQA